MVARRSSLHSPQITVSLTPTDDHADATEYGASTFVFTNSSSGLGTDTGTLFFDSSLFATSGENIDAVYVPEPSTAVLLGLGLVVLSTRRKS